MEKKTEIITQYLSDMHAVEQHIQEALEKQVSQTSDQPQVSAGLQRHALIAKSHGDRLQARMEALGNQDSVLDKAKAAASGLLGQAAGVVDAVRTHQNSKNLRDSYTAGSLASVSYVMLQTTALAYGDKETAQLAETHVGETVEMLQWIARTMPEVVVHDLAEEREAKPDTSAIASISSSPSLSALYGSKA